jgi:hypothetical protein
MEKLLLAWVMDITRGSARKLLMAILPYFQACAWHDGENIKKQLHSKVHDNNSHRPLTKLYHAVLNGAITPAQYQELAPRATPSSWFKYLNDNQFAPDFLPRLDRRCSALVDKPPGDTNNIPEHAHSVIKREGTPVASGEAVDHIMGPSTGDGSDGVSGRLLSEHFDVCEGRDDFPVYAARDILMGSLLRVVSDHALSMKQGLPVASDPQKTTPLPYIRDVEVSLVLSLCYQGCFVNIKVSVMFCQYFLCSSFCRLTVMVKCSS